MATRAGEEQGTMSVRSGEVGRVVGVYTGGVQPFPQGPAATGRGRSGIYKEPVTGPAFVHDAGLSGDENAERPPDDLDQAICAYPVAHYSRWQARFPHKAEQFVPGVLGENLALEEVSEDGVCVGDVFAVGDSLLQVSKPRGPCRKVARRLGLPELVGEMRRSTWIGWYMRVVRPGHLQRDDMFTLVSRPHPDLTVRRVAQARYAGTSRDLAERLAGCDALSHDWRAIFSSRAARASGAEPAHSGGAARSDGTVTGSSPSS